MLKQWGLYQHSRELRISDKQLEPHTQKIINKIDQSSWKVG